MHVLGSTLKEDPRKNIIVIFVSGWHIAGRSGEVGHFEELFPILAQSDLALKHVTQGGPYMPQFCFTLPSARMTGVVLSGSF